MESFMLFSKSAQLLDYAALLGWLSSRRNVGKRLNFKKNLCRFKYQAFHFVLDRNNVILGVPMHLRLVFQRNIILR